MNLSTIGLVVGGVALCGSLVMNAALYKQYKSAMHENATLSATVDVLTAAREADAEAYCEKKRAMESLDETLQERKTLLDQKVVDATSDDELLDSLRGMFKRNP